MAVFEDEVFWSEMKTRTVQRMKKMTGKNRAVLIKRLEQPYGLKVYSSCFRISSDPPWEGYVYELSKDKLQGLPSVMIERQG